MTEHIMGNLLVIGGAEDKEKDCKILKYYYREAGEKRARICVITAASEDGEQAGTTYRDLFMKFGCSNVDVIAIKDRAYANVGENIEKIIQASGIFFTGGDQLRITAMIGGTAMGMALQHLYEQGVIIGGTSAGASVMSDTMIIGGQGDTPGEDLIQMAPGLGLLKGAIIDQHFAQRGRIGRLMTAVSLNPYFLGIGIDEDTSVHITKDGNFRVIGRGTVLIADASCAVISNVDDLNNGKPLALAPVKIHVLSEGWRFNITERISFLSEADRLSMNYSVLPKKEMKQEATSS
ncbi:MULTISPECIES: cyanophycinase [unclassified Dehalobacter]|uniref:cyanophycinase n=1 Tax=unclassified Dehalobacter TaxID=2635733 RepID=UPI000E6CC428|nr:MULTISPECIES: cyanophycinase [unclassified Dehalobacter]RJE47808.1 cyanophycinase [Dehalobacter sp. MCB1]TCX49042.1 cyanophycinase [Dehalobacter sp. 14DCB1]TCX56637.1 cyanophycinase [Dehalobacter sp. 12DCB1]